MIVEIDNFESSSQNNQLMSSCIQQIYNYAFFQTNM